MMRFSFWLIFDYSPIDVLSRNGFYLLLTSADFIEAIRPFTEIISKSDCGLPRDEVTATEVEILEKTLRGS